MSVFPELPLVSVIIPCRNEVRFLGPCLDAILTGDYPAGRMEVLIADGESTDGTTELIEAYAARDARVRRIPNPERITPAALNLAIGAARGEIIARVDAHSAVALDYIRRCVELLDSSGADNAGGVMRTVAQDPGWCAEAIVAALSHRFGVGNSYFRIGAGEPRWVDTVFGGCWRREIFDRIGLFHPDLERSQDMEFSLRLKAAGGRTMLSPAIRSDYFARTRFTDFVRHNFRNGEWAIVPFVHCANIPVSQRHLIPLFFVLALMTAAALAPWTAMPWQAVGLPYTLANVTASLDAAFRRRRPSLAVAAPLIFLTLHLSYGLGSISGIVRASGILLRRWRASGAHLAAAGPPPGKVRAQSAGSSRLPSQDQ